MCADSPFLGRVQALLIQVYLTLLGASSLLFFSKHFVQQTLAEAGHYHQPDSGLIAMAMPHSQSELINSMTDGRYDRFSGKPTEEGI
jgi:hypothetical protein